MKCCSRRKPKRAAASCRGDSRVTVRLRALHLAKSVRTHELQNSVSPYRSADDFYIL